MAETNLIGKTDLARVREVDFTLQFTGSLRTLTEALGITRRVPKQAGAPLKTYRATGTLAAGNVGEGETIPLSHYAVEAVTYGEIALGKWRKATSAEAIIDRGFDQAVLSKDVLYTDRIQLDEEEMEELNRRLRILRDLTANGRLAQRNRPVCAITYFVPCADKNNSAYGYRGQYKTLTDIVWNIDPVRRTVLVGKTQIPMRFILSIESNSLFDNGWELIAP